MRRAIVLLPALLLAACQYTYFYGDSGKRDTQVSGFEALSDKPAPQKVRDRAIRDLGALRQ